MIAAQHKLYMEKALRQAQIAFALGEVPVGAVIVHQGVVVACAHNRTRTTHDPTAHAEVLALREAAQKHGDFRLSGHILYVTLEPCAMCAAAIATARLDALWYGAFDPRAGCAGSVYHLTEDPALGFCVPTFPGLMAEESAVLLKEFFAAKR